jgi:hypothetical protein
MFKPALVAAALALAGCQTVAPEGPLAAAAPAQTLPPDYRQRIVERARKTFFDPYSIRDAQISAPIPGTSFAGQVLTVCVLANAKNRMGGYTGIKPTSFTFRNGEIDVVDSEYSALTCGSAKGYEPFPELERAGSTPPPAARPGPPRKGA